MDKTPHKKWHLSRVFRISCLTFFARNSLEEQKKHHWVDDKIIPENYHNNYYNEVTCFALRRPCRLVKPFRETSGELSKWWEMEVRNDKISFIAVRILHLPADRYWQMVDLVVTENDFDRIGGSRRVDGQRSHFIDNRPGGEAMTDAHS